MFVTKYRRGVLTNPMHTFAEATTRAVRADLNNDTLAISVLARCLNRRNRRPSAMGVYR